MNAKPPYHDLSVIILSGGRSKRMGQDKGLLKGKEIRFVDQAIMTARSVSSHIFVSVGAHNKLFYNNLSEKVIVDVKDDLGPLGGIVSVLNHVHTPWFLVLSVDAPFVSTSSIQELWDNKQKAEGIVFESKGRIHPLIGLYNLKTKSKWQAAMSNNKLKITQIVESFHLQKLEAENNHVSHLKNINTPLEYKMEFEVK
ncbi:MAG: molybdenum cofactor guanylyltransferase [Salibacteraceae bacterium]